MEAEAAEVRFVGPKWGTPRAVGEVSNMSGGLSGLDPKPGELPMARLKFR